MCLKCLECVVIYTFLNSWSEDFSNDRIVSSRLIFKRKCDDEFSIWRNINEQKCLKKNPAVYLTYPRKWTVKTSSCPVVDFVVKLITLSIMNFLCVLIMNLAKFLWYKYLNVTMKRNSNGPTSEREPELFLGTLRSLRKLTFNLQFSF